MKPNCAERFENNTGVTSGNVWSVKQQPSAHTVLNGVTPKLLQQALTARE